MNNSKIIVHYGEKILEKQIPKGWNVIGNLLTEKSTPITDSELIKTLDQPIGTEQLEILAKRKKNAVIVTGDIARPYDGRFVIPLLLDRLNNAGINDKDITIIMGGGSHQEPKKLKEAFINKYGHDVIKRVKIVYHDPDSDLVDMGRTKRGHIIEINRLVAEAEFKIGIGGISPHVFGGYSGGAKCILPGVASRETMIQNHLMLMDKGVGLGLVEGNPVREEMEEVADIVGLDFIFNFILSPEGKIIGAVCGDFRKAYREGVKLAKNLFQSELSQPVDVFFTSGYPYDIHLYQSLVGVCTVLNACADGSTIIHATPSYEGIREGTKKLFSTVSKIGYKSLFEKLKAGERTDESVRSFFYPEINIGVGMTVIKALLERNIRIVVVTENNISKDLANMGFIHTSNIDDAIQLVNKDIKKALVASALTAKVIVTLS